jgi:hypothetical protein
MFLFCLFVCLLVVSRMSIFSAAWRMSPLPANLDKCLALEAFSSEASFTCHTYCDTGPPFYKAISERPMILTSECRALDEGGITTYFKRFEKNHKHFFQQTLPVLCGDKM